MKPPTTIPVAGVAMEVPVVAAIIARSVCRRPVALSNGWRDAAPGRPPLGADAGAGAAVDVLVGVVGDQPLVAERPHLLDDRQERRPLRGQLVLDPRWGLRVARADDHPLDLEHVQALGARPRADPRAGVLELGEPARPLGEVVDDERGPL